MRVRSGRPRTALSALAPMDGSWSVIASAPFRRPAAIGTAVSFAKMPPDSGATYT